MGRKIGTQDGFRSGKTVNATLLYTADDDADHDHGDDADDRVPVREPDSPGCKRGEGH